MTDTYIHMGIVTIEDKYSDSDVCIVGVFSGKEKANAACEALVKELNERASAEEAELEVSHFTVSYTLDEARTMDDFDLDIFFRD